MGIIEYFRRLRKEFSIRKRLQIERTERFYAKCREGIFSFFRPYLTRSGFYLDLEDKKGLTDYLSEGRSANRTVESLVSKEVPIPTISNLGKKIGEYTRPIYDVFRRMINYFHEFPKEQLRNYTSLSFNYEPAMTGYEVHPYKNKLGFSFG